MTKPATLSQKLRPLDPEPIVTAEDRTRGDQLLERTVRQEVNRQKAVTLAWIRHGRRAGVVVATMSVVLAGAFAYSVALSQHAQAEYRKEPMPLTKIEQEALHKACWPEVVRASKDSADFHRYINVEALRDNPSQNMDQMNDGSRVSLNDAKVIQAERRGDVVMLAFVGQTRSFTFVCTAIMQPSTLKPKHTEINGGSAYRTLKEALEPGKLGGPGGYIGGRPQPLLQEVLGAASLPYSYISGRVGSDIVAVTFETQDVGAVKAAVSNGYYSAWWPGKAYECPKGVPNVSGRDHHVPTYRMSITLKSGKVIHDAKPSRDYSVESSTETTKK